MSEILSARCLLCVRQKYIKIFLTSRDHYNFLILYLMNCHRKKCPRYEMASYSPPLKRKCHFDEIFVISCIGSCHKHNNFTGDPLHSRAACTHPCNVNTHSRAHCSPGARLCEQWGHGCVNNGARLCASARLCRGLPVNFQCSQSKQFIKMIISRYSGTACRTHHICCRCPNIQRVPGHLQP